MLTSLGRACVLHGAEEVPFGVPHGGVLAAT